MDEALASVQTLKLTDPDRITSELLERVRKSNYVPATAEKEYGEALYREYRRFLGLPVEDTRAVTEIRILGPGCYKCEELTQRVMTAVAELGLAADVQHVTDLKRIANYGPVPTPALVVNDEIKTMGRVPTLADIKKALAP
jgi:small redox-active disulfide protein 2